MLLTEERLYTVEEIANLLQLHPETVRRKIRAKQIKGVQTGKEYRIREQDIREFLNPEKENKENQEKSQ